MNQTNTIAVSIALGFLMVAAAIYFSGNTVVPIGNEQGVRGGSQNIALAGADETPRRSGDNRLLYGNPDAATTIVEFSDFECPFCARLHPTLKQVVNESGGEVNWEYRHLPLAMHRNADDAALVGECIARELGNESFWEYSDKVFANVRSLSPDFLNGLAVELGFDSEALESCINEPEVMEQVERDVATAVSLGGQGTPFSVIVYPDGSTRPVSGALPYENWQSLLSSN